MTTYLITGGAGFIGSNFILHMLDKCADEVCIVNVDALTYAGNLLNLESVSSLPNYHFERVDIQDSRALKSVFDRYEVDVVIHFAAESHVDRSIENPDVFVKTNVLGTLNLLNCVMEAFSDKNGGFLPGKRFVHVSTDEVYGSLGETGLFTEESPLRPNSPYSASKASSDLLVMAYYKTFGLPINITRCSNNYGPYQFPEKLIPLMISNALEGKKLPVYGDGRNVRDWLYVLDHCRAIELVATKGRIGEVYNIGGNNEWRNIDIVKLVIDTLYRMQNEGDPLRDHLNDSLIEYVEDRKGHDWRYAIDPQKLSDELGWEPLVSFDIGIKLTIAWYLENVEWLKSVKSGKYRNVLE